ncbi:O-antigen ligase family protein [Marinivivus vitaminiproducens]|uniref:O-antigen ligase family protein n=1 Tax=Marinivivus vitaminiproducens TaxID=3035935 RepID=UPI0027A6A291|nr:O-antigen ligase family protein [Geminicoccaceae bacterium SCSIO 64248]
MAKLAWDRSPLPAPAVPMAATRRPGHSAQCSRTNAAFASLSTAAILVVSFSPLLYVPVPRAALFLGLVGLLALFVVARHLLSEADLEPIEWQAVAWYLLFLVYVLGSILFRERAMPDDPMLLPSLGLNLVVMILALHAARARKAALLTLAAMAGVFVGTGLFKIATGGVVTESELGITIFPDPSSDLLQNYQTEGFYLGSFTVLVACGICFARPPWLRLALLPIGAAALYLSLLIGSRSNLIAATVVTTVLFIWRTVRSPAQLPLLAFVICVLLIASQLISLPIEGVEGMWTMQRLGMALTADDDPTLRGYLFTQAMRMFLADETSFLFGGGVGGFGQFVGMVGLFDAPLYPHNLMLELLAEYGLVGAVLYFAPILLLACGRSRFDGTMAGAPWRITAVALMAFLWLAAMGSGGLRLSWLIVFFTYLALAAPRDRTVTS